MKRSEFYEWVYNGEADFMGIEDHGSGHLVVYFCNIEESEEDDEDDN
jgi:hypothetical protein